MIAGPRVQMVDSDKQTGDGPPESRRHEARMHMKPLLKF